MTDADKKYSYEYEESSLTLMNDVQLSTNKDAQLKKNDSNKKNDEKTKSSLITSYDEIFDKLNTFLKTLEDANKKRIKSQHFFSKKDKNEMMKYHNNLNVTNVDLLFK